MKILSFLLLILGCALILYAAFSRFYGEPSIAMGHFRSINIMILGNSILLICLIAMHFQKYLK